MPTNAYSDVSSSGRNGNPDASAGSAGAIDAGGDSKNTLMSSNNAKPSTYPFSNGDSEDPRSEYNIMYSVFITNTTAFSRYSS